MPTHVVIYSKYIGFKPSNADPAKWPDFIFTMLPIDEFEPQYGDIYWFFV